MKKNLIKIIGVLVLTLFCGSLFINNSLDVVAKNKVIQLTEASDKTTAKEENDKKIADLEAKKKDLEAKEIDLKVQKNEEFSTNGFSKRYYELGNELEDITDEIWDIEREIDELENKTFDDVDNDTTDNINDFNNDVIDMMDDFNNEVVVERRSFFDIVFIIPIIMFIVVFIIIITTFVRSSKHISTMTNSTSRKEMLDELSDVAVKMAKDLNPTYKEFKCPNCGAALDPENTDIKNCNYCGAKLYKTVNTHSHSHRK